MNLSQRMNNHTVVSTFLKMIRTSPEDVARELMDNINKEAPNHRRTPDLQAAFMQRFPE